MTTPLSHAAVERIDEICDHFEAACKAGQEPQIDEYLDGAVGPEGEALQEELRRVDAHYRRRATAPSLQAEMLIAGYELLGELGRGGMGVVYKARQLRPNRLVALKMISAGAHARPQELERFLREADAIAQLQHENIVQIYEVGEHEGKPFFAMQYVDGGSLDQHLSGTPQPLRAAAEFVRHLALAIHHAHQHGVIHRDLKPANVLLVSGESSQSTIRHSPLTTHSPKITDFGLAKLLGSAAGNPTQTGDLLGTPSYMAPEQVGGAIPISAATDVYGLGAILYELLTGRPPFRGETALETVTQVQSVEPVSPSRLQPKCPRDLVTICLKCLSKQPRERYPSALELAEDLRRFLDDQPIRARPVGPLRQAWKWTRRQPVVAGLSVLLVVSIISGVATGSWFWWRAEEGLKKSEIALGNEVAAQTARVATLDRYQIALAHREWLANNVERAEALLDACTPEQQQTWEWRYLDRMRHSALHTFAGHTNTIQAISIHPSGRQIASVSHDGSVRLWNLDTDRGTILGLHRPLALSVAYSPDGLLLATSGSGNGVIKLWNAETGALLRDVPYDDKAGATVWALAFDPDSRYLAVGGPRRLKVWDTRDEKWVFNQVAHPGPISQVAFSPDGQYLASATKTVKLWNWAAKSKKPLVEWPGHAAGTHDLAFSPDSTLLATGGRDCLIRVYNLASKDEEFTLNGHQLAVTSVGFSPDGERLASAGQDGDMHVWSVKQRRRLFTLHGHSGAVWDLAYTSDGKRLVSAGSDFLIRAWDATANQEAIALPIQASNEICALAYGPDGRLLAWGDTRGQVGVWDTVLRKEIYRWDSSDAKSPSRVSSIAFSPDGRQATWRRVGGPPTLWDVETASEVPFPGAEQAPLQGLAFSADGRQLMGARWESGELQVRDLRTGQILLTLPRPDHEIQRVVWSPDVRCLVTLEDRKYVRLWDAGTGQFRGELDQLPGLRIITFSADSRLLAMGGIEGKLSVWDLTTKQKLMAVTGHSSNLYGLALSPDGRRLVSAASDCTAKLWDVPTENEVLTFRTQLHEHSPLAFSPDGSDIVAASMDNRLQIWTTRSVHALVQPD